MSEREGSMLVRVTKQSIVDCDTTEFDRALTSAPWPLKHLYNRLVISFCGYDEDPRHVYEIPEVRAYVGKLKRGWPQLFFFLNLDIEELGQTQTFLLFFVKHERTRVSGRTALQFDLDDCSSFIRDEALAIGKFCVESDVPDAMPKIKRIVEKMDQALGLV